jgi:hypothetical protein
MSDQLSESDLKCAGCGYNLTGATIGGRCPECGTTVEESLTARGAVRASNLPSASYVGPVLATIFCCLIGGVVAIVYTSKANTAAGLGNDLEYRAAMRRRGWWLAVSVVAGFLLGFLAILP